jgi:hypothetical protein
MFDQRLEGTGVGVVAVQRGAYLGAEHQSVILPGTAELLAFF